mmetsp:Transcript_46314/g.131608  ORF Transcript_46314/g.131608 Transcript_46314/m.131608 type:complete len:287 (+) Transcript_46314:91-951(+)
MPPKKRITRQDAAAALAPLSPSPSPPPVRKRPAASSGGGASASSSAAASHAAVLRRPSAAPVALAAAPVAKRFRASVGVAAPESEDEGEQEDGYLEEEVEERGRGLRSVGASAASSSRPSSPGRGRGRRGTAASALAHAPASRGSSAPSGDAASSQVASASQQRRRVVRSATAFAELQRDSASIGPGARATVLFHESDFDTAMLLLEPAIVGRIPELAERNGSTLAMLYFVVEAEDHKVEFRLGARGQVQQLSRGAEVLIPPGASYSLRNRSRSQRTVLITVVPLS